MMKPSSAGTTAGVPRGATGSPLGFAATANNAAPKSALGGLAAATARTPHATKAATGPRGPPIGRPTSLSAEFGAGAAVGPGAPQAAWGSAGGGANTATGSIAGSLARATRTTRRQTAGQPPPKYEACVGTLLDGCVGAFIELFTLAHRPPVCVDELAQTHFEIPDDSLPWVQERLMAAEMRKRTSDSSGAMHERKELAGYFERAGDRAEAVRQLQYSLAAAQSSLDPQLEATAHADLSALCARLGLLADAAAHAEKRFKLAAIGGGGPDAKRQAGHTLADVCMQRGKAAAEQGEHEESKAFFERALEVARGLSDPGLEAQAFAALGQATVLLGDLRKALEYQQRTLIAARDANAPHTEAMASLKAAQLQDQLGDAPAAVAALKESLRVAEANSDVTAICDATRQLGETYRGCGDQVKAVHYLKEHFKVARDAGEDETVDAARVMLGFALGEHRFDNAGPSGDGFLRVACDDIAAQLEWMATGTL